MNLKKYLEDLITTSAFQPSNYVGTRTPNGDLKSPSRGPQKQKGKWRLKKAAQPTSIQQRTMNPDPNHPGSPFKIKPAEWEDTEATKFSNKHKDFSIL